VPTSNGDNVPLIAKFTLDSAQGKNKIGT
jgi:hypothetical protein